MPVKDKTEGLTDKELVPATTSVTGIVTGVVLAPDGVKVIVPE
jgi:hypothetical protein